MPEGLQKKIGPLPLWAWALIMGGVIGGVILLRKGSNTGTDGQEVGTDTSGQIFPGATDGASGGSLTGTGGAPTLQDGLTSFTSTVQQLKDAGLWPDVATQGAPVVTPPGLVDLAPGHTYYDPTTGETVSGPEQIAAKSATPSTTTPGKKPSALDRAMTAVQKGSGVGPIRRALLKKHGYTDAQINFHIKHKTPLKQPDNVKAKSKANTPAKGPAKGKPAATASAAATHPLQHVTAAPPNHAKAPAYRTVPGTDSHGNKGVFHVYSDHKVFVRG